MRKFLIVFYNTHNVFLAENLLFKNGYKIEVIATPDDKEDCCGLSIKIKINDKIKLKKLLKKELIEYNSIELLN